MCDEAKLAQWAKQGLNRRQFGILGGVAAIGACAPMAGGSDGEASLPALTERQVSFETSAGTMDGFFVAPASGAAPGVLFWPDIAGLREAKRAMARRLAGRGYAVLVVNPYYRDVAGEQFADFATFAGNGGFQKVKPWRDKLTAQAIMSDATAAVDWLDAQKEVDTARGIGTQGYCMGGPFTFWTAAAVPARVKGVASFHGGGLVREDDPMSPHRTFDDTQAHYLVAIAKNDDAEAPDHKRILREAAAEAGRPARIEVYDGDHGWTVPDSPAYAEPAAEKAFADLMALYATAL
ncbi:dienelactone hydrolase family protein [Citromicrobium sp. WPS32]|uniref:dienelactone hydrolase family protein n=1 Tax=Citromicrobium sp. WPS32 TaxID=1634517 RepID=UPI0006C8FCA5|nr:dienelactone hydrolase family protein [Citromicrobium sp. WPS32]KPM12773.1 dienelactone hydrolase [Citromicrobium sp. WPS32]|tara:strand:+ start:4931 stop:5809 length:879 start_codon:yes stop_codon:yes gene_type:complete